MKKLIILICLLVTGCTTVLDATGYEVSNIGKAQKGEGYCVITIAPGLYLIDKCDGYKIGDKIIITKEK